MANTSLGTLISKGKSEIKIDRTGKVWNNGEWIDAINEAIVEIQNKGDFKWSENQKTTTFSSVVGQQEYDITTLVGDFVGLDLLKYKNVTIGSSNYINLKSLYETFPSGTPNTYYMYGGKIGFSPIPDSVQTIDITYRGIFTDLSTNGDLSPLGTNFDRAIVLYACYALLTKLGDNKNITRANVKMGRFTDIISRLYKTYLLQDKEQIRYRGTYTSRSSNLLLGRHRFKNI